MKTERYILPTWAVPALINEDYNGLIADEVLLIEDFITEVIQSDPGNNCFIVTMPEGESYFHWTNDIVRGQGGDVYDCVVIVNQ